MNFDKPFTVNVRVSDDKEIQKLNKKYFNRDYPTDVLSFSVEDELDNGDIYLGDILINYEQAERQANEYDNDIQHEIAALVEHGMLHLLGVHHEDDDETSIHNVKVKSDNRND